MRIDGSRLVVTCHQCGLSVVAAGFEEGRIESEKAPLEGAAPAGPSGGEVPGGRFELEEGEVFPRSPTAFEKESKVETQPVVKPETPLKIEAKAQNQEVAKTRPTIKVEASPETGPKMPPAIQKEIPSGVVAAPRRPLRMIAVVSGVLVSALVAFYLASPSKRTEEKKLEPKAARTIPTAPPVVEPASAPAPAPAAAAPLPATSSPAPPVEPRPKATPKAQSAPPKPTPKPPAAAAAAVTAVMSETEALSSGLVNTEAFQERAGKITTYILLCGGLERARDSGAAVAAVDVTLIVSPSGAVSRVKLDRGLEASSLGACLRDHLRNLEFPSWAGPAIEIRRRVALGAAQAP